MKNYKFTCKDRFIKYVQIDTTSDPGSKSFPSTEKQKDLSRILADELKAMGINDAHMDESGYVYATIPSNTNKNIPVICFCSHVDTSSDVSGTNVKPVIHKNYKGDKIYLPDNKNAVIDPEEFTYLKKRIGDDIITASGNTLLGADDKAGVAEIMDAANYFMFNKDIPHGTIKILFTPDEETGRGVEKINMDKLGADYGYTLDGGERGSIEFETFSADSMKIKIQGFNTHPGTAKNKMENSVKIASEIVSFLPKELSPEFTEEREGFIHPVNISGTGDSATIEFIIRDFEDEGLKEKELIVKNITEKVLDKYKRSNFEISIKESYRNMRKVVEHHPHMVDYAKEAMKISGVEPVIGIVRGGTDGSKLSYMGLPCPNLFSGGMAIHSLYEYVSVQDMECAVKTIVNLAFIWESKS